MHHTTTAEGKQLLEEAKGCLVWLIGSADSDSHPPARASFSLDLFVNRAPALIREGSMDWRHLAVLRVVVQSIRLKYDGKCNESLFEMFINHRRN